jgi:CYTH domain-containing protein
MNNLEIERKFLVDKEKWSLITKPNGIRYIQGYLSIDNAKVIRVRVAGENGFLTIKGKSSTFSHPEYEYAIPVADAYDLIRQFTSSQVEKIRTRIPAGSHVWEVDEFLGENEGLLMAEIELDSLDEVFEIPSWAVKEVTGDRRYYNSWLSQHPFKTWK